jgi:hypothetical protein
MSKKKANDKYGMDLDVLDVFRFGIILGSIGVMFWAFINILSVWVDHIILDILMTSVYFLFMVSGLTILIDYFMAKRQRGRK